jgi:hypothetical protein
MGFTPGDSRARDAYGEWRTAMGGMAADGSVLPRWDGLTGQEQAAWESSASKTWTDASAALARMNSPTAGLYGNPVRDATAGVHGGPASASSGAAGYVSGYPASAVPLMQP